MSDHERAGPSKVKKAKLTVENQNATDEDDTMLCAYINSLYVSDSLILESTNSESTASNIEKSNSNNQAELGQKVSVP